MKFYLYAAAMVALVASPLHASEVSATQAYAFSTPKTGKAGAAYINLTGGNEADRLIGASSDVAKRVEIHEHQMTDGVMRMREVTAGIELPADGAIEMKPGGYHVMLMGLNDQLEKGEMFPVTLSFESGAELTVSVMVKNRGDHGASAHGHGEHKQGDKKHGNHQADDSHSSHTATTD